MLGSHFALGISHCGCWVMHSGRAGAAVVGHGGGGYEAVGRRKSRGAGADQEQNAHEELVKHFKVTKVTEL